MDEAESEGLKSATKWAIQTYDQEHVFTSNDICELHRIWLKNIYPWAGKYRQVKMSKGGFTFAFPAQIPKLMTDLENTFLRRLTPCNEQVSEKLAASLAQVHTEFLLIHPFREGNGRVARLLASLMALQSGMPLLDFGGIKDKEKEHYFAAVRAGLDRNYEPMERVFRNVIFLTLKNFE